MLLPFLGMASPIRNLLSQHKFEPRKPANQDDLIRDAAQDATAEVLSALQSAYPRFDHRFCFEHYGMSSEHLTRRIKSLGANVSVNPYYVHHRASINVSHMGKDRAHTAARLKQCLDSGTCVYCWML